MENDTNHSAARMVAELRAARAALARLAESCAATDVGRCPIIEAFAAV